MIRKTETLKGMEQNKGEIQVQDLQAGGPENRKREEWIVSNAWFFSVYGQAISPSNETSNEKEGRKEGIGRGKGA